MITIGTDGLTSPPNHGYAHYIMPPAVTHSGLTAPSLLAQSSAPSFYYTYHTRGSDPKLGRAMRVPLAWLCYLKFVRWYRRRVMLWHKWAGNIGDIPLLNSERISQRAAQHFFLRCKCINVVVATVISIRRSHLLLYTPPSLSSTVPRGHMILLGKEVLSYHITLVRRFGIGLFQVFLLFKMLLSCVVLHPYSFSYDTHEM